MAPAHWHLLRPRRKGQRHLLRLQDRQREALDEKVWIYDFRTNEHFTLKTNPLKRADLDDFVACYCAENRHKRKETGRFRAISYDELVKRDKASLDIFWLKDDSLEDAANLAAPEVIAAEIVEDLQAAGRVRPHR